MKKNAEFINIETKGAPNVGYLLFTKISFTIQAQPKSFLVQSKLVISASATINGVSDSL